MLEPHERDFGFAMFDDPKQPRSGWASKSGQDAIRFSAETELRNDVVWLTNISYQDFYQSPISKAPWFRSSSYLPITDVTMMREWGVLANDMSMGVYSRTVSVFFTRICLIAFKLAKKIDPRVTMSDFFVTNTLASDLGQVLPFGSFEFGVEREAMKREASVQSFTSVKFFRGKQFKDLSDVRVRVPRMLMTTSMFQTPVPDGDWTFYNRNELSELFSGDITGGLANLNKPVLAEVTVTSVKGDEGTLFSFGVGGISKGLKVVRSWAPHPEFVILSQVADIEVRSAYIGEAYKLPMAELPEAVQDFLEDDMNEYSWSAGIVAEALRRGYGSKLNEKEFRNNAASVRSDFSKESLWLKSAERAQSYLYALSMNKADQIVMSYNNGVVKCRVADHEKEDFVRATMASGLVPDLFDVPEMPKNKQTTMPWSGDKKSGLLATLHLMRAKTMLLKLDGLPLNSQAERQQILKTFSV